MKEKYDKISTYFKENINIVVPLCITGILYNCLMCFIPKLEGMTIDSLKEENSQKVLELVCLLFSLVIFVQVNRFFKRYLVRVFSNKMILKMRQISLRNLLHKEISFFVSTTTGDILNRNLSDIYDTAEGVRKMTTEVFDTIILLFGYLISMFLMDYKISIGVLIFIIISILFSHYMKKFVYKANKDYKEYLSINKEITLTKLNNELYYRGFGVSKAYSDLYKSSVDILKKKNIKALILQSGLEPLYNSVALLGVFFIAYFGGKNVMNGVYQIGTFSAYLTTYLLVARKAGKVGKVFNAYQAYKVSFGRCKECLKETIEIKEDLKLNETKLTLIDFNYGYKDGFHLPVINLEAKKGEIIGICGRIHRGKSTLLKALTGFYGYEGQGYLGNIPLDKVCTSKFQMMSYCGSNVELFSDTIKNNITLNRKGNLNLCLKASGLEQDMDSLGGLNQTLSHSIHNVSGGQQRRLQTARTLFSIPKLILLDDPFQSVEEALANLMMMELKNYNQSIIVLVSNHPNILKDTDQIIYLKEEVAFVDKYANLIKQADFKELMEGK